MLTAMQGNVETVPPKPYVTVLGKLLVAAIILIPLAAMLFPELNHRSGNNAAKSGQVAPATRSSVMRPALNPFIAGKSDQ